MTPTDREELVVLLREYLEQYVGLKDEEAIQNTPERWLKYLNEMTRGVEVDPKEILKTTFESDEYDELIVLRNVAFVSMCEHHLLPIQGVAHVGYVPWPQAGADRRKVVGLSKLARLVDCFARRPQLQERMTAQITNALMEHLQPRSAGCVVEATHACLACRGARKHEAVMVTSCLKGNFRGSPAARAEFFSLIRGAPGWP